MNPPNKPASKLITVHETPDAQTPRTHFSTATSHIHCVLERLVEQTDGADLPGLPTGLQALDELASGLSCGSLTVLAGRDGLDKTRLGLQIADHVALKIGFPVAYFSMGSSPTDLMRCLLGAQSRIRASDLARAELTEAAWSRLEKAAGLRLTGDRGMPLYIEGSPRLTPTEIWEGARQLARTCGKVGLVVVDDAHEMEAEIPGPEATEPDSQLRTLANLARALMCPVLALVKVQPAVPDGIAAPPGMRDLRRLRLGDLAADTVLFLHTSEPLKTAPGSPRVAELTAAKQLYGFRGVARLAYWCEEGLFEDWPTGPGVR